MPTLTIVADIIARTDSIEQLKTQLEKLVEPTRAEPGCLQYDLHQDNKNPARFLVFENWVSREHWREHIAAAHLQAYLAASEDAVESSTVHEMTRIA